MTSEPDDTAIGQAVLDLDRKMTDPALKEVRRLLRTLQFLAPTPIGDQLDAAERHARALAHAANPDRIEAHPIAHMPAWVRLGLLTEVVTWAHGAGRVCLHSPRPSRPQAIFAAAWQPGFVACQECLHYFKTRTRLCSHCGRAAASGDPHAVQIRFITYFFRVCPDCVFWTPDGG